MFTAVCVHVHARGRVCVREIEAGWEERARRKRERERKEEGGKWREKVKGAR